MAAQTDKQADVPRRHALAIVSSTRTRCPLRADRGVAARVVLCSVHVGACEHTFGSHLHPTRVPLP